MNLLLRLPKDIQRLIDTLVHSYKLHECFKELFTKLQWSDEDDGYVYHGFFIYNHRTLNLYKCRTHICRCGTFDWEEVSRAHIPKRYIYSSGFTKRYGFDGVYPGINNILV